MNWTEARSSCRKLEAHLASIRNKDEQILIKTKLSRYKWNHGAWIGLNDRVTEGKFKWADGSQYQSGQRWHNEPGTTRREDCVEVYVTKESLKWNDNSCEKKLPSICKKIESNNSKIELNAIGINLLIDVVTYYFIVSGTGEHIKKR